MIGENTGQLGNILHQSLNCSRWQFSEGIISGSKHGEWSWTFERIHQVCRRYSRNQGLKGVRANCDINNVWHGFASIHRSALFSIIMSSIGYPMSSNLRESPTFLKKSGIFGGIFFSRNLPIIHYPSSITHYLKRKRCSQHWDIDSAVVVEAFWVKDDEDAGGNADVVVYPEVEVALQLVGGGIFWGNCPASGGNAG